jgi:ABC-type transport system involved in multi-copper enzyme maturation permease subunit
VSGGGSITAHNFPLPYTGRQDIVLSGVLSFFIALGIVIGFAFVAAFYASFLVYERENNVKHQQVHTAWVFVSSCFFVLTLVSIAVLGTCS